MHAGEGVYWVRAMVLAAVLGAAGAGLAEVSDEAERVAELEARWSDSFSAGDLEAVMALMAEGSVLIMPGTSPVVGIDAIREATAEMLASDEVVTWRSDFARVAPGGDMAYDYGTATTRRADGSVVTGNYLVVWVREGGEWKVAADMFN